MNPRFLLMAAEIADNIDTRSLDDIIDTESAATSIEKMFHVKELEPLLEIVYYAVTRDINVKTNPRLEIFIDCNNNKVSSSILISPTKSVSYSHKDKRLFLGTTLSVDEEFDKEFNARNLLYGITLFVIDTVFKNNGEAYFYDERNNYKLNKFFTKITNQSANTDWLTEFNHDQPIESAHVMANVTQLIYLHKSIEPFSMAHPQLAGYYNDVFLPACRTQVALLKSTQQLKSLVRNIIKEPSSVLPHTHFASPKTPPVECIIMGLDSKKLSQ